MIESKHNYRLKGILGIVFGLLCLGSFLIGDNTKLVIPISDIFLVRYFVVICILNGGLYFIVAGILILRGVFVPRLAETNSEYKEVRAKGILISLVLLSPFLISLFTTIFTVSETNFWKVLGSLVFIYVVWLLYSNLRILRVSRKNDGI